MTRLHVLTLVTSAVAAGAAGWYGPALITQWRADRTARRFANAVFEADSLKIASLTRSGSAQNVLCARRLWPAAFWMKRDGTPLAVLRAKPYDGSYGYQTVGDSLPDHKGWAAVFEFYVAPDHPTKVHTVFADSRTGVWNDTVRACIRS
jgi:hypothetical protein